MTFNEAFNDELEKMAVAGRPLGRLLRKASPDERAPFARILRRSRGPIRETIPGSVVPIVPKGEPGFVVKTPNRVVIHPPSREGARINLAGMRGAVGALKRVVGESEVDMRRVRRADETNANIQFQREVDRINDKVNDRTLGFGRGMQKIVDAMTVAKRLAADRGNA